MRETLVEFQTSVSGYERAVELLHYWRRGGSPTNFTSLLFDLIQKSDTHNLRKLSYVYKSEVMAFVHWKNARSEEEFFAKYGLQF